MLRTRSAVPVPRPRARAALAAILCSLAVTAACTDVIEEPAPAPPTSSIAPTGAEQRRPEGGGEVRPTEPNRRTTVPPSSGPRTTTPTEFPPTSCPAGLVC